MKNVIMNDKKLGNKKIGPKQSIINPAKEVLDMNIAKDPKLRPRIKLNPDKIKPKAVILDIDGVLVDVGESYRKAIFETTKYFTGKEPFPGEIQALKEEGGYNNDWTLTCALVRIKGKDVPLEEITAKFQEFYLGTDKVKGFIENERWLLTRENLVALKSKYSLGIVTGRPREEALMVLKRSNVEEFFEVIVAMEDVKKGKPDPEGLFIAMSALKTNKAIYVGDSVDDIIAAKNAGIIPIGCLPPRTTGNELERKLFSLGARRVLKSINQLVKVIK